MKMNRRQFLKSSGALATAGGLSSLTALSSTLTSFSSLAAAGDEYKALVCVFLYGGMDNHDTVLPYDQASYNSYAQIRSSLIPQYQGQRDRNNLLPLTPDNAAEFGGRAFALPPQMPGISNLFHQGNAAIIGNVGPLITPAT
ncbi:twin-arginine translocation signal domain-containing protein [Thalassomonas viridans]|uniref:twin-arginine translocation signal domain-containing protein n=1 Tax=Thalassomonas viridans TaxID=137584 RepID=UPI000B2A46E5|nr:twin-arginine translocation signal domain-containing protein [Thalassomonas viridans]